MSARVLIAETETLLSDLLGGHLKQIIPDAEVLPVRTVQELTQSHHESFDLAIVDLVLADGDILEWLGAKSDASSRSKILVLTSCALEVPLRKLLHSGACGIVHKADGLAFLEIAVRTVLAGGSIVSPRIQEIRSRLHSDPRSFTKILSAREQEILRLIGAGQTVPRIAATLEIQETTVVDHRKNIMRKLGIHKQAGLLAYALQKGFGSYQPAATRTIERPSPRSMG